MIINESDININTSIPKSVSDFMKTDIKDLDYNIIKKAYDDCISDYKKFPDPNTMDSLDIKYDDAKRKFYKKYIDFAKRCREVVKSINPSGYGRNDYFMLKVRDLCRAIDFNFPYGWKNM